MFAAGRVETRSPDEAGGERYGETQHPNSRGLARKGVFAGDKPSGWQAWPARQYVVLMTANARFSDLGGPFGTILADPPWRFQNRTGKLAPEHKRLRRYRTLDVEEICALPIAAHCHF